MRQKNLPFWRFYQNVTKYGVCVSCKVKSKKVNIVFSGYSQWRILTESAKFKMAVRAEDLSNAEQQIDGLSGEKYREIGDQAVWSLSSCKPGFGVEQLRDGNLETYWQSDGPQPHLVSIQFRRKTAIQNLCLYADYKADESYTPSKISIRAGNHFHDLHQIELIELEEPSGWLTVSLSDGDKPLRTYMLQIAVLANHQNGRDTHMRQIKIHAPLADSGTYKMPTFTSVECAMYSTIKWK